MATPTLDEAALFHAARQIADPEARRLYLEEACCGNAELLIRIESLLRVHENERSFLEAPAVTMRNPATWDAGEVPGMMVGPYRLLERLGEGGFGIVFLAEQQQPIRRTVALKILKPGMDTQQVVTRFEGERQALALMDHPNIARVFDGGATPSGRPFFVMELVKGIPITSYCDQHQLTPRERLELFAVVCRAVQHAHQKGIIHRDLKPTNVLIAAYDGKPAPKLIDFGIAKAIGQRLTESTLITGLGNIIGTLDYMSPEQAELNAIDVDTRADIYSLGVLLYELLTGTTPLTHDRLKQAAITEALRLIREEDPPRPSSRLSETRDELASISALRKLEPARLTREVRGDLDWIVMKALDKDRNRRYASAGDFADEIGRYINGEAVLARPPSVIYRLRKLVQRRRGAVLTAAVVTGALLIGSVTATWEAIAANHARDNARDAADESEAVLTFVENQILAAARPEGLAGGLGPEVSLRDALVAALPMVDKSFANQPHVEARLRMTLGASLRFLGEAKIAAGQLERARELFTQLLGPESREALESSESLATAYADLSREPEALALREQTLATRRRNLGPDHPDTLSSMRNLANSFAAAHRDKEALELDRETFARMKAALGPNDPRTLRSMNGLAISHSALKQYRQALEILQDALERYRTALPPDHPDALVVMGNLAKTYSDLNRPDDARKLLEKLITIQMSKTGVRHPNTLHNMYSLAQAFFSLHRYDDALSVHQEVLDGRRTKLGDDHYDTLLSMWGVAETLNRLERGGEAIPVIDLCLTHVRGQEQRADFFRLADLRIRYFKKKKNVVECRKTAELWENIGSTNPMSLYNAGCLRAITASVILETDKTPDKAQHAAPEADRAMHWLQQAVTHGFKDIKTFKKDADLATLRERDDFKKLITDLETVVNRK